MKRKTRPEEVLKNLRNMIEEAEDVLARSRSGELPEEQVSALRDRLQEGFNWLREYSGDMGGRVKGYYSGVEDKMKTYYSDAEDRLRDYYEELEDHLRDRVEATDRTLRDHPYQTASVAFGLGIALGAVVGFLSKSR